MAGSNPVHTIYLGLGVFWLLVFLLVLLAGLTHIRRWRDGTRPEGLPEGIRLLAMASLVALPALRLAGLSFSAATYAAVGLAVLVVVRVCDRRAESLAGTLEQGPEPADG
jgi:uncharacterized membrane protein YhaH (DUF805 family)